MLDGALPATRAAALKLAPLPDALFPDRASPADRAWRLPAEDTAVIAWADGSCSVRMLHGDGRAAFAQMQPLLQSRREGFKPGAIDQPAPDLKRLSYCEARRPHPVVVTFTLPMIAETPRRMAAWSNVFRAQGEGEPSFCAPAHGP